MFIDSVDAFPTNNTTTGRALLRLKHATGEFGARKQNACEILKF